MPHEEEAVFWERTMGHVHDADLERFDRHHTVEIKHGRISVLAILSHLVTTSAGIFVLKRCCLLEGSSLIERRVLT